MQTLRSDVASTDYDMVVTRKGQPALLVSYYLPCGECLKEWLFPWSWATWFTARGCTVPQTVPQAYHLCITGKVLPTGGVMFRREGRWPSVIGSQPKQWPKGFFGMMSEAREVFGDLEVIRVWS